MKTNPTGWTTMVTGGCGYIGRQLCLRLLALGHHVWVVDDLCGGLHPDIWLKDAIKERRVEGGRIVYTLGHKAGSEAPTLTFVHGDLTSVLEQAQPWPTLAAVFHLASVEGDLARLAKDPMRVGMKLAIDGKFFAWAAAHKEIIERLIYVSPKDFNTPGSVMAVAADAGEKLARLAARALGMRVACVRLSSIFGKDQSTGFVVPRIAHKVLRCDATLQLDETLAHCYDFLHVDDAIAALLAASEHLHDGQPVTVGSGSSAFAEDVAQAMARLQERTLTIVAPKPRVERSPLVQQEVARGHQMLHFSPKVPWPEGMAQVMRIAERREQRVRQATMTSPI